MRVLENWSGGPNLEPNEIILLLGREDFAAIYGSFFDRFGLVGASNYDGSPFSTEEADRAIDILRDLQEA